MGVVQHMDGSTVAGDLKLRLSIWRIFTCANNTARSRRFLRMWELRESYPNPNLLQTNAVDIVAACDSNLQTHRKQQGTSRFRGSTKTRTKCLTPKRLTCYTLSYRRTCAPDVEVTAAQKGIHIFSEKPQAITMEVAHRINDAIQQAGVISTVGFRERYRPIFQEARRYLTDKQIVHVRFQSFGGLPPSIEVDRKHGGKRWTNPADAPWIGVFMPPITPVL